MDLRIQLFSLWGSKVFSLSMGALFEVQYRFPSINHTNYVSLAMSRFCFFTVK